MTLEPPREDPEIATDRWRMVAGMCVDDLLAWQPESATALGDHRFDDRLDDLSDEGVAGFLRMVGQRLEELDSLDDLALSHADAVDLEILRHALTTDEFSARVLAEHRWNPLRANPGSASYALLARDFAPLEDRLDALAGRLRGVPDRLETARITLGDMPRVHVETAIGQFSGTVTLLGATVDEAMASAGGEHRRLREVRDAATSALEVHVAWLRSALEDDSRCSRDPRLGAEVYAAKLWATLDADLTPDELLRRAEGDLDLITEQLCEVGSRLTGSVVMPGGPLRELFDILAAEAEVTDDSVLALCESAFVTTTDFVRDQDLVTIYDDEVRIIEMPDIHRGVAVAYCDAPGPLETAALPTFFAVSPTPSDWPVERVRSFYREYNGHLLQDLTIHEAMPGHVLQLAHARRAVTTTPVRQAFQSGPFVEGWAVYAEELMAARGFGGLTGDERGSLAVRATQLKMALRMVINAILDVRVHCHGMTEAEALRLMVERGYQEEGEAIGKWRRALLTSTQLSTYYVGYLGVRDLVDDLHTARTAWSDRQIHDAVLSQGSPSVRHLRTLLDLA